MAVETMALLERSSRRFAVRTAIAFWLRRTGWPRLAVFAVVVLCSASGLGVSRLLRDWGVMAMWLRYPLAWGAAYGAFLMLVGALTSRAARRVKAASNPVRRETVRRQHHNRDCRPRELSEVLDDCFERAREVERHLAHDQNALLGIAILVMSLTIVVVGVYYVWTAPTLIAELAVEGGLVAWLYRPISRGPRAHWLTVALEKTAIPALMIALVLCLCGVSFQFAAPNATSIVETVDQVRQRNLARNANPPGGRANR